MTRLRQGYGGQANFIQNDKAATKWRGGLPWVELF
jgi:hypothetical protein